jgi:TonB family protein
MGPLDISDDPNKDQVDDPADSDLLEGEEEIESLVSLALPRPGRDTYLTIAVVISVLFHAAVLGLLPRVLNLTPRSRLLKPGEEITRVRMVEFPNPPEKPEPPPKKAAALSDRNHTAERERLPKKMPNPLLGQVAPPPPRIAALAPPMAPEDLIKPKEEQREHKPKPVERQKLRSKAVKPEKPTGSSRRGTAGKRRKMDIVPTPGEIARALAGPGGSPGFYPEGNQEEEVIDINSREDRYFSYLLHLKRKIEGVWIYPRVAAENGVGGALIVEFIIYKSGKLLEVKLLDSSGVALLDQSAMKAIRSAAPYHPFPPRLRAKRLRIRAKFIYLTKSFYRRIM